MKPPDAGGMVGQGTPLARVAERIGIRGLSAPVSGKIELGYLAPNNVRLLSRPLANSLSWRSYENARDTKMTQLSPVDGRTAGMNEDDMKVVFLEHSIRNTLIDRACVISSEYVFEGATRRADLAFISRGRFFGVEIKSERDSLRRLQGQLESYLSVFDEVLLLVAPKHVTSAIATAPASVAIFSVSAEGSLGVVRPAETNADRRLASSHLRALPKSELLALMGRPSRRVSRKQLIAEASEVPFEVIRAATLDSFNQRFGLTSEAFWKLTRGKSIEKKHLCALSRFSKKKKEYDRAAARNRKFWKEWSRNIELALSEVRSHKSSQSSSVSYLSSGLS